MDPVTATLLAWLVERGQAPLAGYLAGYLRRFAPWYAAGAVVLTFLLLGLAVASLRGEGEEVPPDRPGGLGLPVLVAVLLAAGIAAGLLGGIPRVGDEAAYLFEARLILAGRAAAPAPAPEVLAACDVPFTAVEGGRWFGAFPPGWPLVLALGLLLGTGWLVNPLLAGLNVWWIGRVATRWGGPELGRGAAWVAALSPFLLVLHGSYMADPLMLALQLGALHALDEERPALAGFLAAAAVSTRPAALFFLAPALLVALLEGRGGKARVDLAAGLGLGAAPVVIGILGWNLLATGAANVFPYQLAAPGPGFLAGGTVYQGMTLRHDPVAAGLNLGMNLGALGALLLGWPGLSLLPALAGVLRGTRLEGARPHLAGGAGLLVGYALYFHPGIVHGPRFYLPALPLLAAWTARGFEVVARARGAAPRDARVRLLAAGWLACAVTVLGGEAAALARYGGTDPRPLTHVRSTLPAARPLLVLVPRVAYPDRPVWRAFLGEVDPFLEAPVLYLEDPGDPAGRAALRARFPGREVWLPPDAGAPWDAAARAGSPGR